MITVKHYKERLFKDRDLLQVAEESTAHEPPQRATLPKDLKPFLVEVLDEDGDQNATV